MYGNFVGSELKKWTRDPLMGFMLFYPIVFGIIGRYVVPIIGEMSGFQPERYGDIILVALTLMTPIVYGALMGFSILDDRDDHILDSIKVTPLSIHQFLSFRVATVLVLSFVACTYVIWFSNIATIPTGNVLALALLASLAAPMSGFVINAFAQNKIEGFAVMKGTGMVIIFPIVALFFTDKKEFIFSFAPGFWPAKAMSSLIRGEGLFNLSYNQYFFIGLIYVVLLNVLLYKVFLNKIKK